MKKIKNDDAKNFMMPMEDMAWPGCCLCSDDSDMCEKQCLKGYTETQLDKFLYSYSKKSDNADFDDILISSKHLTNAEIFIEIC